MSESCYDAAPRHWASANQRDKWYHSADSMLLPSQRTKLIPLYHLSFLRCSYIRPAAIIISSYKYLFWSYYNDHFMRLYHNICSCCIGQFPKRLTRSINNVSILLHGLEVLLLITKRCIIGAVRWLW